jgi:hypothetical protein
MLMSGQALGATQELGEPDCLRKFVWEGSVSVIEPVKVWVVGQPASGAPSASGACTLPTSARGALDEGGEAAINGGRARVTTAETKRATMISTPRLSFVQCVDALIL